MVFANIWSVGWPNSRYHARSTSPSDCPERQQAKSRSICCDSRASEATPFRRMAPNSARLNGFGPALFNRARSDFSAVGSTEPTLPGCGGASAFEGKAVTSLDQSLVSKRPEADLSHGEGLSIN